MFRTSFLALLFGAGLATTAQATELSFDIPGGDGDIISQTYGDRVAGLFHDGLLFSAGPEGYTPNVTVAYEGGAGPAGALWISDYGSLENVAYNPVVGDTAFRIRFRTDPGYTMRLYGFALAGFQLTDRTIAGLTVRDEARDPDEQILFQQGETFVLGGTGCCTSFSFGNGLHGRNLVIDIDLSNLGALSHTVGIDGIRFGQMAGAAVPEPEAWALMILGFMTAGQAFRTRSALSRRPA